MSVFCPDCGVDLALMASMDHALSCPMRPETRRRRKTVGGPRPDAIIEDEFFVRPLADPDVVEAWKTELARQLDEWASDWREAHELPELPSPDAVSAIVKLNLEEGKNMTKRYKPPEEFAVVPRDRRPATAWLADITGDADHAGVYLVDFVRAMTPRAQRSAMRRLRRQQRKEGKK